MKKGALLVYILSALSTIALILGALFFIVCFESINDSIDKSGFLLGCGFVCTIYSVILYCFKYIVQACCIYISKHEDDD